MVKHEWQVEFKLTDPINNWKRFDISVGGTKPEEERRFFRFESNAYYRQVYRWYLSNGEKYIDGRCGESDSSSPEYQACRRIQWETLDQIRNGTEPEFFDTMLGFLYPTVSYFFLLSLDINS